MRTFPPRRTLFKGNFMELTELKKKEEAKKALAVFTAAYYQQIIPEKIEAEKRIKKMNEFFDVILGTEKGNSIISAFLKAAAIDQVVEKTRVRTRKFFNLKHAENAEEIMEDLKAVGLEEKNFTTLAICAADKDMEKVSDFLYGDDGDEEPEEEIVAVRRASIAVAGSAIADYRKGNRQAYAGLLGMGLRNCCEKFAGEQSRERAMYWASNVEDILFLIEKNPELAKECGITDRQIRIAKEIASISENIKKGLQAVEIFADVQLYKNIQLSADQTQKLLVDITQMQIASSKRLNIMDKWDEPSASPLK